MSSAGPCFAERELSALGADRARRFTPAPVAPGGPSVLDLAERALEEPVALEPIDVLARGAARVAVVVSDASRDEPREELLRALLPRLPAARTTLVVAAGTHTADDSVIPGFARAWPIVVHDARDERRMVDLGRTSAGTRVRVLREVASADLVVITGRLRPHYFAGWSGGIKGVFPGCALAEDALTNHLLKADPTARLGRADGNRCRRDMEEAAARVPGTLAILNVLCDVDGTPVRAASGHPVQAHRALAADAAGLFTVRAPRASVVIVADRPPVSSSLYQASKCLPPAGALLEEGGTVIVVAECEQGLGPTERVNEGIYRLGMVPQLPAEHRVVLVSQQPPDRVATTYAEHAPELRGAVDAALARHGAERAVALWRAGECIAIAE
ncbi:MAG: DUF2088 domain-containing protein [Polyangiaceae bacterium]|nr:DUF2088 domain-containing protein [Polyangiaceae bacterium]